MSRKKLARQKRTMQRLIRDYKRYVHYNWDTRQFQTASHIFNLSKKHADLRNMAQEKLDMWQIAQRMQEYVRPIAEKEEKDLLQLKMNSWR